ncbi:MAG TPA: glycosyltransferase family 1 protein [Turneriella sp.]|nr:glycosyltransferase family 1 protein [Turneriella sp.]
MQSYEDLEIQGLLKLSRFKRRHFVPLHTSVKTNLYIPPFSNYFLRSNAIFHGVDFKIPKTTRLPRVVTIHDLGFFEESFSTMSFLTQKRAYCNYLITRLKPNRIIVPSEFIKEQLITRFPITREIVRVAYHGSEQAMEAVINNQWNKELEGLGQFILCPGTVEIRKNCLRLIEAFEKTKASHTVSLIFAGGAGFGYEEIRERAAASPLSKRIHFYSELSRAKFSALYKNALFTIYPSVYEGFGLPIVEAFALGSPLITANIGAMLEVAGDAAFCVNPYSVEELTGAIDILANDDSVRNDLAKRGHERAKFFTWKKAAIITRGVYEELRA